MSGSQTSLGTVALFDASDDTIAMVQALLAEAGASQCLIGCRFADLKCGVVDVQKYLEEHNPEVVVVEISPPYEQNWRFFDTIRRSAAMRGRGLVVTTTSKDRLDELVGSDSYAIEVVGLPADRARIVEAIKSATRFARTARLALA